MPYRPQNVKKERRSREHPHHPVCYQPQDPIPVLTTEKSYFASLPNQKKTWAAWRHFLGAKKTQIQARERVPGKAGFIPSHTPPHSGQKVSLPSSLFFMALRAYTILCCLSSQRWARPAHCAYSDTFWGQLEGGRLWQERGILRARRSFSVEILLMCPLSNNQKVNNGQNSEVSRNRPNLTLL